MTISNMRQWLATAKATWTLPLARPEVEQIVAERDALVRALTLALECLDRDGAASAAAALNTHGRSALCAAGVEYDWRPEALAARHVSEGAA
jgi:hypothetical protein